MPPPLSLKQRLTQLNTSLSSPTSPSSPSKFSFNLPSPSATKSAFHGFVNRARATNPARTFGLGRERERGKEGMDDLEEVDRIMQRIIFPAGVDYETRPM